MTVTRWLAVLVLVVAAWFALQGGEYSTFALRSLRTQEQVEAQRIKQLRREVDSLGAVAKLVETDLETQERIAREQHGMLKRGEHAFIIEDGEGKEERGEGRR
jgi:cell division protein FtsB